MTRVHRALPGLLTVAPITLLCCLPGEEGGAPEDLSLGDTIDAAIDYHSEEPGEGAAVTRDGSPEGGDQGKPAATPAEPSGEPSGDGRVRDAMGRFVKPAPGPAAAATGQPTPPAGIPPAPQPGVYNAPQSWTPAAREAWATIPPAAQAEIVRRENEIQRGLVESASARNIATAFSQACTPYLGRMRMQGVTPIQALDNLLATEMTLGQGSPIQKAQTIAKMIQVYGIDIETLDSVLVGQQPTGQAAIDSQVQALVQQHLAPYQQFMQNVQQHQQQRMQASEQEIGAEIDAFAADPKHEFYSDVRLIMADLIDVASQNNLPITMQEAYDRAVLLNPQTREVVEARQRASVAQGLNGAARRARSAAVTVTGSPALGSPDGEPPATLRESIAAAMDAGQRV